MPHTGFDYRFGIEEEFFVSRADTGALVKRLPRDLIRAARQDLGESISAEMLQSQIEISSPILRDAGQARSTMNSLRQGLAALLARHELALVAAGTHPLGAWREQSTTRKPRYTRLLDDFQLIARRNLVCGLHVHVEIPPGVDRVALMNRVLPWLPLFLALSTSSPFWNRQRSGLLSYRQSVYDEWPRSGIPDFFADEADYGAFVALLQRDGAIADASSLWWGLRPSPRFPTLELRIADSCTRLDDALALAALFRCLVRLLLRRPDLGSTRSAMTRRVIDENRWRAKRHGLQAQFLREDGAPLAVEEQLAQLRAACGEDAVALDCETTLAALDALATRGSSAHEQLAVYQSRRREGASRSQALHSVLDWLLHTTALPA